MLRSCALLLAVQLAACGGNSQPRLRDVTITTTNGTVSSVRLLEFDYSETELTRVTFLADNAVEGSVDVSYTTEGQPRLIRWMAPDGTPLEAVEHFFDDEGVMLRTESTRQTTLLDFTVADARRTDRFHYSEQQLLQIDSLEREPFDTDLEVIRQWNARFDYNDEDRLQRVTEEASADDIVTDFEYDEEQRLDRILTTIGDVILADAYNYDDDGRLDRVTTDAATYSLSYAAERVEEITVSVRNGGQRRIRYSYADEGETTGLVMTPAVPGQQFFAIDGSELDEVTFLGLDILGPL